jgi:hypothetical protein
VLTIKRKAFVHQEVAFDIPVTELVEGFTDEQLRTVGLYRDLRDADIERSRKIEEQFRLDSARANHFCDDEDCECACHTAPHGKSVPKTGDPLAERHFWPLIRALIVRGDLKGVRAELDRRSWDYGNTTIELPEFKARA